MYAHIFAAPRAKKAAGMKFQLLITQTCDLAGNDSIPLFFASKNEAKAEAKRLGAKAWNY